MTILALATSLVFGPAASADHRHGCPAEPAPNFGGDGDPSHHNWANVCTPAGSVYFFGTFGDVAQGDPSGMCGYLVADGAAPADVVIGMAGDWRDGRPNPIPVAGTGDFDDDHSEVGCDPA